MIEYDQGLPKKNCELKANGDIHTRLVHGTVYDDGRIGAVLGKPHIGAIGPSTCLPLASIFSHFTSVHSRTAWYNLVLLLGFDHSASPGLPGASWTVRHSAKVHCFPINPCRP